MPELWELSRGSGIRGFRYPASRVPNLPGMRSNKLVRGQQVCNLRAGKVRLHLPRMGRARLGTRANFTENKRGITDIPLFSPAGGLVSGNNKKWRYML